MNQENHEFDPSIQELEAKLARWKVDRPTIDPNVVFYQAGFAAAGVHSRNRVWNQRLITAACALVAIGFSSLFSYRAGQLTVVGEEVRIAAKNPEPSTAPKNDLAEDSRQVELVGVTEVDPNADLSVQPSSGFMILCNQWLQNKLPLENSRNKDLLAAADPNRQLDQHVSQQSSVNNSKSMHVDHYELIDTPEYAMLKKERARRSQRWANWLSTL